MSDNDGENNEKSEETERLLQELARDHPVQAALGRAFEVRIRQYTASGMRGDTARCDGLMAEMEEIADWFSGAPQQGGPHFNQSDRSKPDFLTDMIRQGLLTYPQAAEVDRIEPRHRQGRRISDGIRVISALEAKKKGRALSWTKLASKFCDKTEGKHQRDKTEEDKNQHDPGCADRLRHRVKMLEKLLARLSRGENA